ncbi:MAG: site-specific integrase [Verrucomicrobia bacterium]|nr:site-specific integrase [Verrucomicrobiota bacterium]
MTEQAPRLLKVEKLPNLYRLLLPGDKPNKPSGAYYAVIKRGRKQFRRTLRSKDRKLAQRRLAELKNKIGNLVASDEAGLSFDATAERWLALTGHELKPRSLERRRTSLKGLSPFFRGLALRNVTKAHCERWLTERGSKVAPQTFAHELTALKRTFDYAVEQGLILGNPASHIRRRKIHQAEITIPTREQFQQLITSIRLSDGRAGSQRKATPGADLIELLAYSGARLGEATALCWRDINFAKGTVTITGGEGGTKNNESRTIPMTDALRGLLTRLHEERQPAPDDEVSPIKDAKTTLRKACKRLGLPAFSHHDFRHMFATTCIEAGVDIPTVSRWLGHKDGGALAMKVYGHLRDEHSAAQIKKVSFAPVQEPSNILPLPAAATA